MELVLSPSARRDLRAIDPPTQRRILSKLEWFVRTDDPLVFAEPITDSRIGTHRFRIGDWRVTFDVDRGRIVILRIGHRSDIYR